jgi:hypothetical protein
LSYSYRIQDSDSYDNIESSFTVIGLDNLWIRNSLLKPLDTSTTAAYTVKSVVSKDDIRLAGRYNPFEAFPIQGRLSVVRTLTTNFTYSGTDEHSYITGTKRDVYTRVWPDFIFGLSQIEKALYVERWVSDSQLNLRDQKKVSKTEKVSTSENSSYGSDLRFNLLRKLDLNCAFSGAHNQDFDLINNVYTAKGENITWSYQTGYNMGVWRFTLRYDNAQNWAKDGTDKVTGQLFTNTYTGTIYSDTSFPGGIKLPLMNRPLPLNNRVTFSSSVKYINQSSALNVERDNTDTYSLSTNADYEVSANFRISIGAGYSRLINRVKSDENYSTIEASGRLTIQF